MTDQNSATLDLCTSSGGRAYIADYFATQLRRHDFAEYINSTLAADFACALAQRLSKMRAEGVEAGATDAQEAFATWWNAQDEGSIQFDLEQYPQDLKATLNNLWNTAWRAGLASAPVAGKAVAIPLRPLTEDERAAIEFYILNPTAAVRDLDKRLSGHAAPPAREAVPDVNALTAAEYQQWIDWFHKGRDYDSFLKECVLNKTRADKDGAGSKEHQ